MGKTRLSLRGAGAVAALAVALLGGCGDDESSAEDAPDRDDAGEVTSGSDDEPADDEPGSDGSDGGDGSEDGDTGATPDEDADDDVETLEVTIADGVVSPPFDTHGVALGTEVRIEITSDVADELHLHGYDLELELEPGEPGVLEFTADREGRFELETHSTGLQLLQLEVG